MIPPRNSLERHSLYMMSAAMAGHLGNYVFHTLSGRFLNLAEYGLLSAVLGLLQMGGLPLQAFSLSLAAGVARDPGAAAPLFASWRKRLPVVFLLAGAALLPAALAAGAPPLLLMLLPPLMAAGALLSLQGALLQGLQRFSWMALRSVGLFPGRALVLALILLAGFRSGTAALFAHVLAVLFTLTIGQISLNHLPPPSPSPLRGLLRDSLRSLPALAGFAVLMSADVVLARMLWDPDTAGRFAQAAIPARMILWLPLPIASALFPKIAARDREGRRLFRRAAVYTLVLLFGAWGACQILPHLILRVLYGPPGTGGHPGDWLRAMATAMLPLGLAHLLLQAQLARGRPLHLLLLPLLAAVYLLTAKVLSPEPASLISLLNCICALAALGLLAGGFAATRRPATAVSHL